VPEQLSRGRKRGKSDTPTVLSDSCGRDNVKVVLSECFPLCGVSEQKGIFGDLNFIAHRAVLTSKEFPEGGNANYECIFS
jgi:hypothetical protein